MGGGPSSDGPSGPVLGNMPVTGEVLGTGPIRVAMLLPISATGNAGVLGGQLKNAAALALREFSAPTIQIMIKDTGGTPEGARLAATEALSQGAELILGPVFAAEVTAVASVARPSRVPVIAFSTDLSVSSPGVYLLSFLPRSDIDRIVQYAVSQGRRSFGALLPASSYGTVAEAAFMEAVSRYGGRVVAVERYALDRLAMQSSAEAMAEIANSGQIDTLLMPDAGDAVPFMTQVLSSRRVRTSEIKYIGSGQWNNDSRIRSESTLVGGWFPAPEETGFNSFASRYAASFGGTPVRAASLGYDAASLAAGLASRFGEQRFAPQTLTQSSGFAGVDGVFRLMPDGSNQRSLAIYEVVQGSTRLLDPAPGTFAATSFGVPGLGGGLASAATAPGPSGISPTIVGSIPRPPTGSGFGAPAFGNAPGL
ncbi:MAG: penicillin-binding protein activator [Bauldia sp.]|nr:penicillin-binding protein activator [Bauldia sp.]